MPTRLPGAPLLSLPKVRGEESGDLYVRCEKGTRRDWRRVPCKAVLSPRPCSVLGRNRVLGRAQSSLAAAGSFVWMRSMTVESVSVVTSPS